MLCAIYRSNKRDQTYLYVEKKVKQSLNEQGYYLQVPPPMENLLNMHLENGEK
jgi:uncharacterized protein YcgL (UPF0745 family)